MYTTHLPYVCINIHSLIFMGLIVSPHLSPTNLYIKALTFNMTVFGDKEVQS